MNTKIYNQMKHILVLFLLVCSVLSVYAQNKQGAKISDVALGSSLPYTSAVLELESTTKGFLLPRMTTLERDAIAVTDASRGNGLTIYNIDTNCINYWSKKTSEWLSICGKMMPAIVELGDCDQIWISTAAGSELKQGEYLSEVDVLYVEIKVTKPGTVDIKASTDNGYFFTGNGEYTATGTYMIPLKGMGTPANSSAGDEVKFVINGKEYINCNFTIEVRSSAVSYTVTQNTAASGVATASGVAYIGTPLLPAVNFVEIEVMVIEIGYWRIESATSQAGISLSGSGNFSTTGAQKVTLVVQGTPTVGGDHMFKVKTNSPTNPLPTQDVVKVVVKPIDFTTLCGDTNYPIQSIGTYTEDSQIGSNNYIQMPITVLGSGKATITLVAEAQDSNGVKIQDLEFVARDVNLVMGQNVADVQYVYLKAPDVKLSKGVTKIVFKSLVSNPNTSVNLIVCTELDVIEVEKQPINYTLTCSSVKAYGNYFVDKDLNATTEYIELEVKANYVSEYNIKTDVIDGVHFEGSGTFTGLGTQKVRLLPQGKFTTGGNMQFTITTNSEVVNTTCSVSINVTYRDVNILFLGNAGYGPVKSTTYSAGRMINNKALFGPNGIVRVNNITLFASSYLKSDKLKAFIVANKIDIIFLGYSFNIDAGSVDVIEDFVKNQKGFFVYSDEIEMNKQDKGVALLNRMSGVSGVTVNALNEDYVNNFTTTSGPLVTGSFGDITASDHFGLDVLHAYYVTLPTGSDLVPLAVKPADNSQVIFGMHKTLGFVFTGDGGWAAGDVTNKSNHIFPAMVSSDNRPIRKNGYGRNNNATVANAILYANLMEYAIQYVTKNKNDWKMN